MCDATLRVHGYDNLYLAGSSVFPTGGAANPTLTIAALSFRLAESPAGKDGLTWTPVDSPSVSHPRRRCPMLGVVPEAAARLVGPLGERPSPRSRQPASAPSTLAFVDYQGWIIPVADRDAIRGASTTAKAPADTSERRPYRRR